MIISHKHKYLFIEIAHTGSSAISDTLCELYDGKTILHKHANYREFEKNASEEEKNYFVFAAVRNPLDDAATSYQKYINYPREKYKGNKRNEKICDFIKNDDNDFGDYLKAFYMHPYTNQLNDNKRYCNYIMRYENLSEELSKVLRLLGIKEIKPLPTRNKTEGKKNYLEYYPKEKDVIMHVKKNFGPFMSEWGYNFPQSWSDIDINSTTRLITQIEYEFIKKVTLHSSKYENYSSKSGDGGFLLKQMNNLKNLTEALYQKINEK